MGKHCFGNLYTVPIAADFSSYKICAIKDQKTDVFSDICSQILGVFNLLFIKKTFSLKKTQYFCSSNLLKNHFLLYFNDDINL